MFVNYIHTGEIWNRETIKFDDCFFFHVAQSIHSSDAHDPRNVLETSQQPDWPQ